MFEPPAETPSTTGTHAQPVGEPAVLPAPTDPSARLLASLATKHDDSLHVQATLLGFIEAIGSELELRPLLTRILGSACELIGADNGTIGLVDAEGKRVRTESLYNMPDEELGAEMPAGVGLAGEVLRTGEPVLLARYGDVKHPTLPDLLENAVLGMPIAGPGGMMGVFGIGRSAVWRDEVLERPQPFRTEDAAVLALFARHAAVAITNARRYTREQERRARLERIARIGQIITTDLRLTDLLERAADATHVTLAYPNVAIALLDPEDPTVLVLATVGGRYKSFVRGEYRIPVDRGIMGAAARERRTQLVNDVASDPRHLPTPGAEGITAELAIPIQLGERVLGVLNVESDRPFDDEDAAGLQIIADHLAVAIENARLYARGQRVAVLEERQRLARDLHDSVTQHIFGMVLMGESLAPAWRRDTHEGERRTARLVELSRTALAEMRTLLSELRPDVEGSTAEPAAASGVARLRRSGLAAALKAMVQDLAIEAPIVHVDSSGYRPQPMESEEALYRIAQEALHNVIKHACAGTARITVANVDDEVCMEVVDEGVGFRPGRRKFARGGRTAGGLGLTTMRERAEARGGSLRIESSPGQGTRVQVRIPADGGKNR